jgi:hypothetical protein
VLKSDFSGRCGGKMLRPSRFTSSNRHPFRLIAMQGCEGSEQCQVVTCLGKFRPQSFVLT